MPDCPPIAFPTSTNRTVRAASRKVVFTVLLIFFLLRHPLR
jgi:hypothetical protein